MPPCMAPRAPIAAGVSPSLPLAPDDVRPALEEHLARAFKRGLYGDPPAYYDQNLVLFAQGFSESRYRFGADGSLAPAWETRCIGRAR